MQPLDVMPTEYPLLGKADVEDFAVNEALQAELSALAKCDLRVRAESVTSCKLFGGYDAQLSEVHK